MPAALTAVSATAVANGYTVDEPTTRTKSLAPPLLPLPDPLQAESAMQDTAMIAVVLSERMAISFNSLIRFFGN
jgi:hypothetical protein